MSYKKFYEMGKQVWGIFDNEELIDKYRSKKLAMKEKKRFESIRLNDLELVRL